MTPPQHVAHQPAVHNQRRGLGIMDNDQIGFQRNICGVCFQIVQIRFKKFLKSNRLIHALERIVKLLGDLKERIMTLDGIPTGVDTE